MGDFCNLCGQKSKVERINYKYLIFEIPNSIFQLNRGFLFTIKELLIRPGHSIREFLEGKRVHHYKPLGFLFLSSTLYVLITFLLGKDTPASDLTSKMALMIKQGQGQGQVVFEKTIILELLNWISKFQIYIPLFMLPLFSLSSYIVFYKSRYNYFEHLVINFYITGQQVIIYLILGLIFFKDPKYLSLLISIGMLYNIWTFIQVFKDKKFFQKIGLIALSYLVDVILFIITILIYSLIYSIS